MAQLLSPRRLTFRGHIEVAALAFPRSLFSQTELQKRVLSMWANGARLEEFDWGHVLFLPSTQRMRVDQAPATPLVKSKNRFVSAPLERDDELEQGLWIIENGDWHELKNGRLVDISLWLDAGAWKFPATASLGTVPEVPLVLAPLELDLRSEVGIGTPDGKWQTIWERGGGNRLMSDFAPGFWLQQAGRLVTPPREVNGKVIASDGSIVLSATLVLGGALLFFLSSFARPAQAGSAASALMELVLFLGFVAWARRQNSGSSSSSSGQVPPQSNTIPLFVVSDKVRTTAIVLLALGMMRVALVSPENAGVAFVLLFIAWVVGRNTFLLGRLVGRQPTGARSTLVSPTGTASGSGGWFGRWFRARSKASGSPSPGASSALSRWFGKKGEPGPPPPDPLGDAWRRLLAQAALQSGLFKQLGRAQARYLLRSMELFERGDMEAALRHAIALGAKADAALSPPPALGVPNARGDLNLSMFNVPARGSMNFGPEIEGKLRALYRSAFEKLRDQGDWQKAAFVLADLLQNAEEAVAFLEEQKQFELAAKLAEGRDLAPGLVVRAWWLAGNRERALTIARLKNAFSDAITRLERDPKNRDNAANLRLLWGHHLAQSGRFAPAVEAVWPVAVGRPLAQKWLRLGLKHNVSPRLLARALSLEPGSWSEWLPLLEALWNDERGEDGARERELLARELANQKSESNPALQVAARETARAVMSDSARSFGTIERAAWDNLISLASDGMLRADSKWRAPQTKPSAFVATGGETLDIRIESSEGTLNALDAVLLDNGELLVALGEMGARLFARDGHVKAHFDVPAHRIVRAFDAPRALLIARRDDSLRVTKLELTTRKTQFWGDVRADCFADCFDGVTWFVAGEGRVRALDVSASSPAALWDGGDMNGTVKQLAMSRTSLAALVEHRVPANSFLPAVRGAIAGDVSFESWRFELPSLILRARRTPTNFSLPDAPTWSRLLSLNGSQFGIGIDEENAERPLMWAPEKPAYPVEKGAIAVDGAWLSSQSESALLCWQDANGPLASLLRWQSIKIVARLHFVGASSVQARECDGVWLLWDDRGRVVSWNPTSGHREREWVL